MHPSQTVAEGPCSRLALELCSLVWPGAGPSLAKPASGEAEAAGLLPIMLGIPLRLVHLLHGRWLLLTFCVCSPSLALFWQRKWTRLDQLLRD